jgi:FAD-dependent oxidoreductase domain-containing protein 1
MTAPKRYDVAIIGGGVIGSAIAYFLASNDDFDGRIAVLERDSTYETAATARSVGGIRQQFSTPENIQMSLFGAQFVRNADRYLSVDGASLHLPFVENGYLFLATDAGMPILRANHETQAALGADIALFEAMALGRRFPWLNVEGLAGGAYGLSGEGWTDPYSLMQAFRQKAIALGVDWIRAEVVGLDRSASRIAALELGDGSAIQCGYAVSAAGWHAQDLAAMAGIDLPVRPRKRLVFVFACREPLERVPLTIDPTGVYFRPEGATYLCGVSPAADRDPDCTDFEIDYALYEEAIWPTLAARVPAFEAIRLERAWAGHYDYNLLDQNAILGSHPAVSNLLFATGFSGHGLQQSPAAGRAIAELVTYGEYRSLDLRRFGFSRILAQEPLREINVV